jgi:pSer/pThr/pTyr-binding forkhead associated (FHA) protein
MPLMRCPKCGQAYDVPGAVAVRLPNSIATCHCGEWISGSKAAVLARMLNPDQIREVDLQPYKVSERGPSRFEDISDPEPSDPRQFTRSVHVVARGASEPVDKVFTISEHPLWIGSHGCHVTLDDADVAPRHCAIAVRGKKIILRDGGSAPGTFLDGQKIDEAVIGDGVHLLRLGSALISIESSDAAGVAVGALKAEAEPVFEEPLLDSMLERATGEQPKPSPQSSRVMLVCIDGPLKGQEFEIPPGGLVVGREGHVRVPDEFLSRQHFEVIAGGDGIVRVRDLGSRNGTFLNTLPARNTKVQQGDEIKAGNNRFRIDRA